MSDVDREAPVLTTPREWRGFLREYSELYLAEAEEHQLDELSAEQVDKAWVGSDPATEEAVAAAEERLGIRFPTGFRSFLLTSNGWSGVGGWVDTVYSCEWICWMRDGRGAGLIDLYSADPDDEFGALFRRCLEVASGEDFWLLDPGAVGPDGEWAAYLFEPKYGELQEYADFAELFHSSQEEFED